MIPKARVEMIDGAGHMLPYEQPDPFVQAIQKFLG
jgi:pimeloyl-ACP methyl ester carboxylesterase